MHPNLPSLEISGWVEKRMSTSGIAWRRPVRAGSLTVGNSLGRSLQRGEEVKIIFESRCVSLEKRIDKRSEFHPPISPLSLP